MIYMTYIPLRRIIKKRDLDRALYWLNIAIENESPPYIIDALNRLIDGLTYERNILNAPKILFSKSNI